MTKREKELLKRVDELERKVKQLEAQPKQEIHHHWPVYQPVYIPEPQPMPTPWIVPYSPYTPVYAFTTYGGSYFISTGRGTCDMIAQ